MNDTLPILPPPRTTVLETPEVLRQLVRSHRALAELKGIATVIPDASILISTLVVQEARDSSTIENIITSQDEVFTAMLYEERSTNLAAKEVHRYAKAVTVGYTILQKQGLLRSSDVVAIHGTLCDSTTGFRRVPGTVLKNAATGDIVYRPPQDAKEIERLMSNFLQAYHNSEEWGVDPLIQMAVLHYHFESIHPFYDGNGRTGRILNLLHLVLNGLLDTPILYLSRAIEREKERYYSLLQSVRTDGTWEEWIIFMLRAIEVTAAETLQKVTAIRALMQACKHRIRSEQPKIYSQELLSNIFRHPYTKIDFVMRDCSISRPTAAKYLSTLETMGILRKHKAHRLNIYVHTDLFALLSE